MRVVRRGSNLTLFFIVSALAALLIASMRLDLTAWWLSMTVVLIATVMGGGSPLRIGIANALLITFGGVLLFNSLFINPVYHPQGIYYAMTFIAAAVCASANSAWLIDHGFKILCFIVSLLSLWAILQWLTGSLFLDEPGLRARALFTTPNTLATTLNLALTPLLAYYLLGKGNNSIYGLILLMFAALLASQSRGGYWGLTFSMLCFMGYVGTRSIKLNIARYRKATIGFAGVVVFFRLYAGLGFAHWSAANVEATLTQGDSSSRFEIYGMALPLLSQHFWSGIGYFNFGYYFEMHKVPPFLDGVTLFVHNDYLQLALETGVAGIGVFLALIMVIVVYVLKFRNQARTEENLPLTLALVAVASMLAHALVDFPFYIPALIAVFSIYVGIIDRQLLELGMRSFALPALPPLPGLRPQFVGGLALVMVTVWLGLPVVAEAAAGFGLQRLQQGNAYRGLWWHDMARNLQPRDAVYYWREGVILRDQGVARRDMELVGRSDAMFAAGIEVNPFELNNRLARAALHRQHRSLLGNPASPIQILAWTQDARRLQPYSDTVQIEYARALAFAGRRTEATEQARLLVEKRPKSRAAKMLLQEIESGKA